MMVDGWIPFPMATDVEGKVGTVYGAYSETKGIELRGTFLIDLDGVVQSVVIQAESLGRNVDETFRQIQDAQHVRDSENKEATPVGSIPGKITLTPSAELIGKVCDKWKV